MAELETVGIKAFSDKVSSYIRKATLGVIIFISDRGRIVAELRTPSGNLDRDVSDNPLLLELAKSGQVRLRSKVKQKFPRGKALLSKGKTKSILNSLREE